MQFPEFIYHPNPIETGSVIESDLVCKCCGKERGYIYVGPVYCEDELEESICPWCIADGSAHEKFDASFTDEEGVGGYGDWDSVPEEAIEAVAYRTPGFSGWQQEQWWTHCGDAAAFVGRAGCKELQSFGQEAVAAIRESTGLSEGQRWNEFFSALDKEGSPTAYIFRCIKCGALGGYQDSD
jgi:uncharacterized protein CbrC (UPF0167 family)